MGSRFQDLYIPSVLRAATDLLRPRITRRPDDGSIVEQGTHAELLAK
ncbi:MAG: hypothetical protein QMD04_10530 [Anaerolineales bacterium]|nr:hypothetical protein [Anaerolineales bacterium]